MGSGELGSGVEVGVGVGGGMRSGKLGLGVRVVGFGREGWIRGGGWDGEGLGWGQESWGPRS